jgi:hypothetical protein
MTGFQWILIVAISALAAATLVLARRGALGRGAAAAWLVLLAIGLLASIDPERVTRVANAMGIRRGADLLLYLLVLAVLQGFLLIYIRLRRVRRELTLVVRRMALLEAERSPASEPAGNGQAPRPPAESGGSS